MKTLQVSSVIFALLISVYAGGYGPLTGTRTGHTNAGTGTVTGSFGGRPGRPNTGMGGVTEGSRIPGIITPTAGLSGSGPSIAGSAGIGDFRPNNIGRPGFGARNEITGIVTGVGPMGTRSVPGSGQTEISRSGLPGVVQSGSQTYRPGIGASNAGVYGPGTTQNGAQTFGQGIGGSNTGVYRPGTVQSGSQTNGPETGAINAGMYRPGAARSGTQRSGSGIGAINTGVYGPDTTQSSAQTYGQGIGASNTGVYRPGTVQSGSRAYGSGIGANNAGVYGPGTTQSGVRLDGTSVGGAYSYTETGEENYAPKPFEFNIQSFDELGNTQFRQEEGDGTGNVQGVYGYADNQGLYRQVTYVANAEGFKAIVQTNEPGTDDKENPADVQMIVEQTPAGIQPEFGSGGAGRQGGSGAIYRISDTASRRGVGNIPAVGGSRIAGLGLDGGLNGHRVSGIAGIGGVPEIAGVGTASGIAGVDGVSGIVGIGGTPRFSRGISERGDSQFVGVGGAQGVAGVGGIRGISGIAEVGGVPGIVRIAGIPAVGGSVVAGRNLGGIARVPVGGIGGVGNIIPESGFISAPRLSGTSPTSGLSSLSGGRIAGSTIGRVTPVSSGGVGNAAQGVFGNELGSISGIRGVGNIAGGVPNTSGAGSIVGSRAVQCVGLSCSGNNNAFGGTGNTRGLGAGQGVKSGKSGY